MSLSFGNRGIRKNKIHCLKKNMNASRPSEHPPVRGENVKTFSGWYHNRLQRQNLFSWYLNVFPNGTNIGSTV